MKKSAASALSLDHAPVATLTPAVAKSPDGGLGTTTSSWSVSNCCD